MGYLRAISTWIGKHSLISILLVGIAIAAVLTTWNVVERTNGILTEPVQRGPIVQSVYGIGTIMANRSFQLRLGVVSTIDALYIKEGDLVKKGDKLAKLQGVVYQAPFDGTITLLPFKVGENTFTQTPIVSLVDLSDRYLVVSLEQQGALRVKKGQHAKMSFDSIRQESYDGVVQSVYPNETSFLARIDVAKLPRQVLPGMTSDVAIQINKVDDAILVPVAALEQGHVCWVKRGLSLPKRVEIEIGIVDKAMAQVVSGDVQVGDLLLIRRKQSK